MAAQFFDAVKTTFLSIVKLFRLAAKMIGIFVKIVIATIVIGLLVVGWSVSRADAQTPLLSQTDSETLASPLSVIDGQEILCLDINGFVDAVEVALLGGEESESTVFVTLGGQNSVETLDIVDTETSPKEFYTFTFAPPVDATECDTIFFSMTGAGDDIPSPYSSNDSASYQYSDMTCDGGGVCSESRDLYFVFFGETAPMFDFFGDFSILGSVTTGVQETGENTWPLLAFVGVPTSFVIGRRLISLIQLMV